jgi:SpoIID/LytB domain protein
LRRRGIRTEATPVRLSKKLGLAVAGAVGGLAAVFVVVFAVAVAAGLMGAPPAQAAAQAGDFVFTGRGWGHGVGMSQWGARGQALLGRSYLEILRFYYTGVTIETR